MAPWVRSIVGCLFVWGLSAAPVAAADLGPAQPATCMAARPSFSPAEGRACVRRGGTLTPDGARCLLRFRDGGAACTDGRQCLGKICLASDVGAGHCAPDSGTTCLSSIMVEGHVQAVCVDFRGTGG